MTTSVSSINAAEVGAHTKSSHECVKELSLLEIGRDTLLRKDLLPLAKKYIWWELPEDAIKTPLRLLAQVMNLGTFQDVLLLEKIVGTNALREVISNAEAGWFDARSWSYWHYRLDLSEIDCIPLLPERSFS